MISFLLVSELKIPSLYLLLDLSSYDGYSIAFTIQFFAKISLKLNLVNVQNCQNLILSF